MNYDHKDIPDNKVTHYNTKVMIPDFYFKDLPKGNNKPKVETEQEEDKNDE